MSKKENGEVYPLLTTDWLGTPTYRQKPMARFVRRDEDEESVQELEDDEEIFDIIDQKKKRSVNMVWLDVFLLIIDFIQILAVIQSMATRWVFPEKWLRNTYFIFGFNVDVWEMVKFTDTSTYISVQGHDLDSADVNADYKYICYAWFAGTVVLAVLYGILHIFMKWFFYPHQWARRLMSWIQFSCMILIHILTLPIGIVLFRLFQCEGTFNKVYTMNDYDCFTADHWKFAAPAIIYMLAVFLLYPAFLVWKIRQEGMTGTAKGYLSFILMKETEYKIHLNRAWLNDSMWIFSSFKHRGRYYRTALQLVKLILLIIFAGAFNYIKIQSMCTTILLVLVLIAAILIRPFRLTSCNAFLIFSILCNIGTAFLGSLISAYDSYTIPSAWLTAGYVIWFLVFIQACWLASLAVLLIYLLTRTLCHSTKSCYKRPVWPNIATSGSGHLTCETKKFMTAIIKSKIAYEKFERMPAMFAPVHELARHIQVINTYCREAEYMQDALHLVLWEVLDDLVELHAKISPTSIFAESVKKSIRRTATEFMKLVPMFSQRLAQRDYEMILVPPHKKRLLLKMYIMGIFLNGRSEKIAKRKLLEPAAEKMWPKMPPTTEFQEEDGYYEDLYPAPFHGTYGDDLLNVVVDHSTDGESTEEEDNVQGMLRKLPEIGIIDLETPVIGGNRADDDDEEEEDSSLALPTHKPGVSFGHVTSSDRQTPRPISAHSSSSSSSNSTTVEKRPDSSASSLFSSHASLRQDMGSSASLKARSLSPTVSQGSRGRGLSPTQAQARPTSAGSSHSGRDRSPTGSSVLSSQPDVLGSAGSLSDHELASINPGYVPDPDEGNQEAPPTAAGQNQTIVDDDNDDGHSLVTMATTATQDSSKQKHKKKKPKSKKTK